ncbi:MAG: DUF2272 domain-containing protein [Phreatobacter sp.]|uniref:DUF2272 domain-containing protein n=1 Tax=Phreatobacter sp. TaxID=1966341 RepID=UPI001A3C1BD6|nr:DUF2272 domain-containing protein [Phreatobacter sp.]MBL8568612.1 DUF2272 domain-containing protein [Phreatobacter sp.]
MRIPVPCLPVLAIAVAAAVCQPAVAQSFAPAEAAGLDRLCRETARGPLAPTAIAIAATAEAEHQGFGGHVLDRDGRMLRFGAVEADAWRDEALGRRVPWRQVIRYWETLGGLGEGPLALRRHPGLERDAGAAGGGDLIPLAQALERLRFTDLPEPQREALAQAAFRAAVTDIPWSAAFVSHVVLTAGVPRPRFAASMAHLDYVGEAARRSRAELSGEAATAFYRACDPRRTPMRPGDLLCLHRHQPADLPDIDARTGLFGALTAAMARGERPVWNLHCDIVVSRDERRRTASLIGGNVLQSVVRRDIATDRRGALAAARRGPACFEDRAPGTLCRPEGAPWFVLLQAVTAE